MMMLVVVVWCGRILGWLLHSLLFCGGRVGFFFLEHGRQVRRGGTSFTIAAIWLSKRDYLEGLDGMYYSSKRCISKGGWTEDGVQGGEVQKTPSLFSLNSEPFMKMR